MPFFSIIIPLYNKEDYIKATIESVLVQSFQDFELIIINDGSTDNSLEVVRCITENVKNTVIINQENKGLSASRNKGISMANGKVIALLDADDLWHESFLKELHKLYLTFPNASLYGTDYYEKYSNGNLLSPKKNLDVSIKNMLFLVDDFFKANMFQPIISQSNFAIKKDVFKDIQFDETIDFAEDIDFYIKANLKYKFAYSYKALSYVRFDIPNQMTSNNFKDKRLPNFNIYEKEASSNISLKKYLDSNRYFLLIKSKLSNDKKNYNLMFEQLDFKNLTFKQKLLLKSPLPILRLIKFIKKTFLKYNIRLTSFNG